MTVCSLHMWGWEHRMSAWPIQFSCTLGRALRRKFQVFYFFEFKIVFRRFCKLHWGHNRPLQIILSMIHSLLWSSLCSFTFTGNIWELFNVYLRNFMRLANKLTSYIMKALDKKGQFYSFCIATMVSFSL